jgi:Cu(I)/Ag(I) efflux system protein CusF
MKRLILTIALMTIAVPAVAEEAAKPATAPAIQAPAPDAALPQGTGKINSIDAAKNTVNITHKAIPAIKWPGMTMDFPVAKDVALSGFKAGDAVTFQLRQTDNGEYTIVSLKPVANAPQMGSDMKDMIKNMPMDKSMKGMIDNKSN